MTGTPAGTAVPDAEVLACPAAQPYLALVQPDLRADRDPAGGRLHLTTLPPGPWLL